MELKLTGETKNDDGTVLLQWEMDEKSAAKLCEIGTKFLLYCEILGVSPDELFNDLEGIIGEE
jgi:hypothetical protein